MDGSLSAPLVGSQIHGFHTLQELDVATIMAEAKTRWLRPNEIHAMLCNHKYFKINVKPVHLPPSGTIRLFDRKMLRNFRKDGHNWKKKKDGKTVKEAHEHLKVGNEERIHVYYAHGQDTPTFVRRCYWLLDKSLEHIVLVHYRETQELQASPITPVNSHSSSVSDPSTPWAVTEEFDSGAQTAGYAGEQTSLGPGDSSTVRNHDIRIHEINTLDWDELVTNDVNHPAAPERDKSMFFDQQNQLAVGGSPNDASCLPAYNLPTDISPFCDLTGSNLQNNHIQLSVPESGCNQNQIMGGQVSLTAQMKDSDVLGTSDPLQSNHIQFNVPESACNQNQIMGSKVSINTQAKDSNVLQTGDPLDFLVNDGLQSQDSFGRWMNYIMADSPISEGDHVLNSSGHDSFSPPTLENHQSHLPEQIFVITDMSPAWVYSTEKTKILVTGSFYQDYQHLAKSNLFCVCGDVCCPTEIVQVGVYRCLLSQHSPGLVNLYMSLDGQKPISQVLNFEYRTPLLHEPVAPIDDQSKWEEFHLQMRLTHLLFSTSKSLNILSGKVSSTSLREAKKFARKTSHISNRWAYLVKSIQETQASYSQAKDELFKISLENKLKEWLVERIAEGCKITEHDAQGQGVIHLCAILGYTWAIHLFSWSGFSLDFRDKHGWTALHWAAYYGREKMVAVLLSVGAKANLVTDPTKENPGGCTPGDLAFINGFDGLAAYLSEKALVEQMKEMTVAGNVSGSSTQAGTTKVDINAEKYNEEELYLKDTLTAYRTAADAAARIQVAFREHSLKVRMKAAQTSSPEDEARNIVAAMKIQHAFRNFESRKRMVAAAHIQHRFRTYKMRKEFLYMRRQAIKIQAAFRGFQVRRQYGKILWSVGVLEKAILRWRLKRKGFRGLQVNSDETAADQKQDSDTEEDFYRTSRKQAEDRIERSVVRVQAMFRSKKAQQDYRRMKLAHNEATLEYEGLHDPDTDMDARSF